MNNKVSIASLREVADNIDYIKRSNLNIISIRDTSPGKNQYYYDIIDNAGLSNLLVVNFDDIIEPIDPKWGKSERPPEETDIVEILEWAKQKISENNNGFIVHCTAGISRSSAVAILVKYLQDPEKALKVINPALHCPNSKVLEIGEKLLNTNNIKAPTQQLMNQYTEEFLAQKDKSSPSAF